MANVTRGRGPTHSANSGCELLPEGGVLVIVSEEWRAFHAWPILTEVAARGGGKNITYSNLAETLGHGATRRTLGCMLDLIGGYCHRHGLPPLTRVVVSASSGRPGEGYQKWDRSREDEVYVFDWASLENPFTYAKDG